MHYEYIKACSPPLFQFGLIFPFLTILFLWRNAPSRQLSVLSLPSCVDLTRQPQTAWRQPPYVIHSPAPTRLSGNRPALTEPGTSSRLWALSLKCAIKPALPPPPCTSMGFRSCQSARPDESHPPPHHSPPSLPPIPAACRCGCQRVLFSVFLLLSKNLNHKIIVDTCFQGFHCFFIKQVGLFVFLHSWAGAL